MALPKGGQRRYSKWEVKFVPETISARITQVADEAKERAQEGLVVYADLDVTIAPVLDENGITGPDRAKYLALARKVKKAAMRVSGNALDTQVLGLKQYFVSSFGCDPTIADKVIEAVVGKVPAY